MKSPTSQGRLHWSPLATKKGALVCACYTLVVAISANYSLGVAWSLTSMLKGCSNDQTAVPLDTRNSQEDKTTGAVSFPALKGNGYEIWQPINSEVDSTGPTIKLLSEPEEWIELLLARYEWLDHITKGNEERPRKDRAVLAYTEMLKNHVMGLAYGNEERGASIDPIPYVANPVVPSHRKWGMDWAYLGVTMTGEIRLDNVRTLLRNITLEDIPGDYIETGVWRGGSSIFARGVLRALGEGSRRRSFVCDSFKGLPPGDRHLHPGDRNWDRLSYLQVSAPQVKNHFVEAGLLDHNVIFAKGFFNDTMPVLKDKIQKLAVMRLDGDMYESTVDVLYNLYDKLSVGGYVIMDDWSDFPSKYACLDFFQVHGFQPKIVAIDELSSYWQKEKEIDIQYWRYEKNQFKPDVQMA